MNLNEKRNENIDWELNPSNAMKCSLELEELMFKEARATSWKKMRQRVSKETGQDLNDVMRYYPSGKSSKNKSKNSKQNDKLVFSQ